MTKLEILQHIATNHNNLAHIMVRGDDAIMMGETLKNLRMLVQSLQQDVEEENDKDAGDE